MSSDSDTESNSGTFRSFAEHYSEEEMSIILIVIGGILFFFPEPITTFVGVGSIILGIITWFSDWLWG